MKFGTSVADIIKLTQFGYDAFRFDISIVHCLGLQFFRGHSVVIQDLYVCPSVTLWYCFKWLNSKRVAR